MPRALRKRSGRAPGPLRGVSGDPPGASHSDPHPEIRTRDHPKQRKFGADEDPDPVSPEGTNIRGRHTPKRRKFGAVAPRSEKKSISPSHETGEFVSCTRTPQGFDKRGNVCPAHEHLRVRETRKAISTTWTPKGGLTFYLAHGHLLRV